MSATTLLLCAALLAQGDAVETPTADESATYEPYVAPASAEAALSSAGFTVPDGFRVELWAAEPLVANPVAFAFDRFGACYVAETFRLHAGVTDMREHMDWLHDELASTTVRDRVAMYAKHAGDAFHETYETECDRVRRVVDADGDGTADSATVFADDFCTAAAGIGAGVLPTDDGVYFTCMPDLWFLTDEDGDGVADEQRSLSTGYGVHVALLGHDLHGLVIGPDCRLYFSCGDRGLDVLTPEITRLSLPHTGAVLRCELDGSNLELYHTGLRNPQELAFDDHGNLFTGDNNSDGGDHARIVQIVDGADTGWRFHYQYVTYPEPRGPWNIERQWKPHFAGQSAFLLPPAANLTSGPSGLAHYPGTGLSQDYAGRFFLCDFRGGASYSNVVSFALEPKGAGFALTDSAIFLDGVLATDVDFGPDSSMYVLDWVHGWGMTGKGRVWRVPPKDEAEAARADEVRALLAGDWSSREALELRGLLAHRDRRVRQAAQFALVDRGAEGHALLEDAARAGGALLERLHGVWGLGVVAREDAASLGVLLALIDDEDAEVRAQAARTLGDRFDAYDAREALGADFDASLIDALTTAMHDESPRVASHAALAAARVVRARGGDDEALTGAAVALLSRARDADPVLRHSGVMALAAAATSADPDPLAAPDAPAATRGALFRRVAASDDPHVRMGACLAARRHRSLGALAGFLQDDDPLIRREAARALHELDDASLRGSHLLAPQLTRSDRTDPIFLRFALVANARLGTKTAAERCADFTVGTRGTEELRNEAMDLIATWTEPSPVDPIHGGWFPLVPREVPFLRQLTIEIASSIMDAPDAAVRTWLTMATQQKLREAEPIARELCSDDDRPGATRAAALEVLRITHSRYYIPFVTAGVEDEDPEFRAACVEHLPNLPSSKSLPVIETMLASDAVADRRAAYAALAQYESAEAAALLDSAFGRLEEELAVRRGEREDAPTDPARAAWIPDAAKLELFRAVEDRFPTKACETLGIDGARRDELLGADGVPSRPLPITGDVLELVARAGGDVERGRALFEGRVELSCLRCHPHDAGGAPSIGPSLDGVGSRLSRDELLESILRPNATISAGFGAETVRMDDDTIVVGRVVAETADELEMVDDRGEVWVLDRARIAERVPALSAMPTNLPDFVSPEELRDLIEYLASRTDGAAEDEAR